MTHSYSWHLILAVGWELSWDCLSACLHIVLVAFASHSMVPGFQEDGSQEQAFQKGTSDKLPGQLRATARIGTVSFLLCSVGQNSLRFKGLEK